MPKLCQILPSKGIGDALIMMPLAHHYAQKGYAVTMVHPLLIELRDWFPSVKFESAPVKSDLTIFQNDNKRKIPEEALVVYPSYDKSRHPSLKEGDIVCDTSQPLISSFPSKETGIVPPETLQTDPDLVAIHPTSSVPERTWRAGAFVKIARKLLKTGKQPFFAVSERERPDWEWVQKYGIALPHFKTLSSAASMIGRSSLLIGNESGLSHLASSLGVPTIVISGNFKRIQSWQPGWGRVQTVTASRWIPNLKGLRLRENYWKRLITVNKVLKLIDN